MDVVGHSMGGKSWMEIDDLVCTRLTPGESVDDVVVACTFVVTDPKEPRQRVSSRRSRDRDIVDRLWLAFVEFSGPARKIGAQKEILRVTRLNCRGAHGGYWDDDPSHFECSIKR